MRPIFLIIPLALAITRRADAQPVPEPPPQTARQALLEMFTGRTPDALEKHLPAAARKALLQGEGLSASPAFMELSRFQAGVAMAGQQLQTFDVGPTLLALEEAPGQRKLEVTVERDDLQGDADEIELSFQSFRDGAPEPLPVIPRLTFSLKQENEVWTLSEITLALRVPLDDPDYLKGLQKQQNEALESSAIGSLRTLNTAEISYAASFPQRGYTCKLAQLASADPGSQPSPDHAMLIDDSLANGEKSGYVFSLSGCDVRPASKYRATAVPANPESSMRAFCSDESAIIRYAADGKAATCMSDGVPLQ